jgi:hypothetical protein
MVTKEQFKVTGDELLGKVKQIIREGNVRRLKIKNKGRTVLELPLTIGAPAAAIGIIWAPVLAAVGALAALVTESTIEVERIDDTEKPDADKKK